MDFRSYWPSWPDRASSTLVLVNSNSTTVDDLFRLLFGANSSFQVRLGSATSDRYAVPQFSSAMAAIAEATRAATSHDHALRMCSCYVLFLSCRLTNQLRVQARARETRGFTNYSESEWVSRAEELPCLPGGFSWTCPAPADSEKLTGADFQFRMRKARSPPAVHHCTTNSPTTIIS